MFYNFFPRARRFREQIIASKLLIEHYVLRTKDVGCRDFEIFITGRSCRTVITDTFILTILLESMTCHDRVFVKKHVVLK